MRGESRVYPFGKYRVRAGLQPRGPATAAQAIVTALDPENTLFFLPLGADAVEGIRGKLDSVRDELDRWENVSVLTAFESTDG